MNLLGMLFGVLMVLGYVLSVNLQTAYEQDKSASAAVLSGQLRAYGSYVSKFAKSNPSINRVVSDSESAIPSWMVKPAGAVGVAQLGKGIVYVPMPNAADANSAARACRPAQICGVTRGGVLYEPGKVAPVAVTMPVGVPDATFVYVR